MYEIKGSIAEMHFILNGHDHGILARIPYKKGGFHVVADIYGTTKQVRIIQLYAVPSLFDICMTFIMRLVNSVEGIDQLPLPERLKDYLTGRQKCFT